MHRPGLDQRDADSAGAPWAGRSFGDHPISTDDGSAPPGLIAALESFRAGGCSVADVVDEIRVSRLLIPLVAESGEIGVGVGGRATDTSAELAVVTVAGPDGRRVLPVFSSVAAMSAWKPAARPVPVDAVRIGLAAASENTDLVVLDPGSVTEFVVRRPAVWALAQGIPWIPSFLDGEVLAAFRAAAEPEASVVAVVLDSGDATARLTGPESAVTIGVRAGLGRGELDALLGRLRLRISANDLITARVDSLSIRVVDEADLDSAADAGAR